MEKYPNRYFSRPGQNSARTIKILKNPMQVFVVVQKKFSMKNTFLHRDKKKVDLKELLNTTSDEKKQVKRLVLTPTSSFRTQSREDFYRPLSKISSPTCNHYNLNYSLTDRHVPSPKFILPDLQRRKSLKKVRKSPSPLNVLKQ